MPSWFCRVGAGGPATLGKFKRLRLRWRLTVAGPLLAGLILSLHGWYVLFGGNFFTVVPGVYRSAQPSPGQLEAWVRTYGIRTVINLRGDNTDPWYFEEHATGRRLAVQVIDVGMWAKHPPQVDMLRLLVDTLADAPGPLLIHCGSGGDRAGLAAALAILLRTDGTLAAARAQLSIFYGHHPFGMAVCNDRLLDRYAEWLAGRQHSPQRLRRWVQEAYVPQACR